MNISIRLEKLEKVINTSREDVNSLFEKFGVFPMIFIFDKKVSEEEQQEIIKRQRAEYYIKMAKGLNITPEKAREFHAEAYKKAGLNYVEFIVDLVD